MADLFQTLLMTSFHGSIVILAILLLRILLHKAPKKYICMLWILAGIRLLLPIPIESAYSLQPHSFYITISSGVTYVLLALWVALAMAISTYSIGSYFRLRNQVMDAVKVPGGYESDKIETAFVLGFIKPKIYIPTGMSRETRKQILAHERTHLEKGDHWIKMIGFLALMLHWFNPLVWISYILFCKDIEMACDERVVQFMELDERKLYSSALLRCSTNRPRYAACPVAFGEISVKYRIKSILNYRKPSFWMSLLALISLVFVAVCLMTSPKTVVEVPVDADVPLREMSQEKPEDFIPAEIPEVEPNPDWGLNVLVDISSPTSGTVIYEIEERFAAVSEKMTIKDAYLERWNGTAWEPVPNRLANTSIIDPYYIHFATSRQYKVNYLTEDLYWALHYGALPAGDYQLCQTLESVSDSAVFRTPFHIYREELPSEEEAVLKRCETALTDLTRQMEYSILLSESGPNGKVYPTKRITKSSAITRIDHYMGEYCVSSSNSENALYLASGWDAPFKLDQNRQFLFPEGQAVISPEEVVFFSVWADFNNTVYHGKDTFIFRDDGRLKSAERVIQTVDSTGNVIDEQVLRMESLVQNQSAEFLLYAQDINSYKLADSIETTKSSPWDIFFRVDDDLLSPTYGEVWISTEAVGVTNYTTDGNYWLEKKVGEKWERLGDENTQASWGEETIDIVSKTTVRDADWSSFYGSLEAGVYRMGKHFYKGDESMIQYAEFAIHQTGGIYGEGAEEALARVDAAIEKMKNSNYRVEQYNPNYFAENLCMTTVHWKYGDVAVTDFYNDAENYSHSCVDGPDGLFYNEWLNRNRYESAYDSIYFPEGYSLISDQEIRFVYSYSSDSADNPCVLYTYKFDEEGNMTEVLEEHCYSMTKGFVTRYVVTNTPESEIKAWVEAKQAEQ